ncbi:unnamed protein product [Periconia digitata]|uniref:DUF2461 domain-containing protein n=1 Tax=Periconia digitata TaxID=1303443 RepID=A0A9W4UPW2_9PLEO|nr:unnamed protein product [Periconia digitata]
MARSSSKRAAPEPPSRQSKRAKAARKSYAEPESDDGADDAMNQKPQKNRSTREESDFDDDEVGEAVPTSESDAEGSDSEANDPPTKSTGSRGRTKSGKAELWRDGAKLELGKQVVIKKPKAREAGNVAYTDETIHPNTMLFLEDLRNHNERQWLKAHDADYRTSLQDFTSFLEKLTDRISEVDTTIPELPVKDIIFRIYRDVRFSKDQTPYKTHFSAAWSRTGKKGPYAAYYVQIEPGGGSFVGGGLWQPEAGALSALRRDIDRRPQRIKQVLNDAGMRQCFFGGVGANDKKTVKAFVGQSMNSSTALKKHPKGYDASHKDIELLRLRSFTVGAKLGDDEVVGAGGLDRIARVISSMVPFISYLNGVVMPDEESSGSSEDESEEDEDEDEDGSASVE